MKKKILIILNITYITLIIFYLKEIINTYINYDMSWSISLSDSILFTSLQFFIPIIIIKLILFKLKNK